MLNAVDIQFAFPGAKALFLNADGDRGNTDALKLVNLTFKNAGDKEEVFGTALIIRKRSYFGNTKTMNLNAMKSLLTLFAAVVVAICASHAQGNLQFSQVKIIGNSIETVPVGKVWKVTAVYGSENVCLNKNNAENTTWTWRRMAVTNFLVNGVSIISSEVDYESRNWCNSGCTTCILNWPNDKRDRPANPNILPFWLPENATLVSGGPNIFLSLIEFNVIP